MASIRQLLLSTVILTLLSTTLSAQKRNKELLGNVTILCSTEKVDLRDYELYMNYQGVPIAVFDKKFVFPIDNNFLKSQPDPVLLPEGASIDNIICSPKGNVIIRDGEWIKELRADSIINLVQISDMKFEIYPALSEANVICLVKQGVNKCNVVYFLDVGSLQAVELFATFYDLDGIICLGLSAFAFSGKVVYTYKDDTGYYSFMSDDKINSMVLCSRTGLFFATDSGVYLFESRNSATKIYDKGACKLLSYGDTLFVLDNEGTFVKFTDMNSVISNLKSK